MRFGFERKTRTGMHDMVVVNEYHNEKNDKTYCRITKDFETSNNIYDKSFEELCEQYGVRLYFEV